MPNLSNEQRALLEERLDKIERSRARPLSEDDVQHLLDAMCSPDPEERASAVRSFCPCRVPWELFFRVRKDVKRLQRDPDSVVRANAFHLEEDAREVAMFEATRHRIEEYEQDIEDGRGGRKFNKRNGGRKRSRRATQTARWMAAQR